jgi:hypothetical protein
MAQFPWPIGERIMIKPQSFGVEQRKEASAIATERGVGVRMEVHSSHTEFWMEAGIPLGHVEVWVCRTYKGRLEYDCLLRSPDADWRLPSER